MTTSTGSKPPTKKCPTCGKPNPPMWVPPVRMKNTGDVIPFTGKWVTFPECEPCDKKKHDDHALRSENIAAHERLTDAGLNEPYLLGLSFQMFDKDKPERKRVADEIRPVWERLKAQKQMSNLFLSGSAGTGKTLIAVSFLKSAMKRGLRVRFNAVPELIIGLRSKIMSNGFEEELNRLTSVDVLCLDDMGAEKTTDWVNETLYLIIDKWYRLQKNGLIITSNLSLGDISARFGDRLSSRIAGMCQVVDFKGCPDGRL